MIAAVVDFGPNELLVAICASEFLKSGKHLPEYMAPRYLFLTQELNEFINVPQLISLVLLYNPSVVVDKYIGFGTDHPLTLIVGVKGIAVDTVVEHVVFFFEQVL